MSSWIYLFSKFTPEAILIEVFLLCILSALYSAYWFIRRRRTMEDGMIPAGVVKNYISTLIADEEQLRAHLFSLLAGSGIDSATLAQLSSGGGMPTMQANVDLQPILDAIGRLGTGTVSAAPAAITIAPGDNAAALQAMLVEKQKIEQELALLKASKGSAGAGAGDGALVAELQSKIQVLEAKLAEYSVIEDDLANLKRLQQENAQLKAQLAGLAGGATATAPAAAPAAGAAAAAPVAAATTDANFEGLVDQVEQSLATTTAPKDPNELTVPENIVELATAPPPAEVAAPAAPAPAAEAAASTSGPTSVSVGQNDADLVAEFEKMLSG